MGNIYKPMFCGRLQFGMQKATVERISFIKLIKRVGFVCTKLEDILMKVIDITEHTHVLLCIKKLISRLSRLLKYTWKYFINW